MGMKKFPPEKSAILRAFGSVLRGSRPPPHPIPFVAVTFSIFYRTSPLTPSCVLIYKPASHESSLFYVSQESSPCPSHLSPYFLTNIAGHKQTIFSPAKDTQLFPLPSWLFSLPLKQALYRFQRIETSHTGPSPLVFPSSESPLLSTRRLVFRPVPS